MAVPPSAVPHTRLAGDWVAVADGRHLELKVRSVNVDMASRDGGIAEVVATFRMKFRVHVSLSIRHA